jgi:prepilin-type processing-associated H-X9-DG protein
MPPANRPRVKTKLPDRNSAVVTGLADFLEKPHRLKAFAEITDQDGMVMRKAKQSLVSGARGDRGCRQGLTISELMTTMAIITLLAGLVLPSLGKAQARTRSAVCLNDLKQLQLAWMLYADDNEQNLAPNFSSVNAGKSDLTPSWVAGWLTYEADPDNTNIFNLLGSEFGRLGGHLSVPKVYRCPADKSAAQFGQARLPRVRSFSMNCYVGRSGMVPGPEAELFLKTTDFIDPPPACTWVLIDEHEDSIDDGSFLMSRPTEEPYLVWHDLPASRHAGGANLSFADGHVEMRKWLDPRTRKKVEQQKFCYASSPGNRDCAWLLERTTARR